MLELLFLFYCIGVMVTFKCNALLSMLGFIIGLLWYGVAAATAVSLGWRKSSHG